MIELTVGPGPKPFILIRDTPDQKLLMPGEPQLPKTPYLMTREGPFEIFSRISLSGITLGIIADSLSHIGRYSNLVGEFYSVAEHSVRGAQIALDAHWVTLGDIGVIDAGQYAPQCNRNWREHRQRLALLMLLHDAPEAFLGDIASPLKRTLWVEDHASGEEGEYIRMQELENRVNRRISRALKVRPASYSERTSIKAIDQALFVIEACYLFGEEEMRRVQLSGQGVPLSVPLSAVQDALHSFRLTWDNSGWQPRFAEKMWTGEYGTLGNTWGTLSGTPKDCEDNDLGTPGTPM
jgi:hypothetical protein